jgi:hypothetical protein
VVALERRVDRAHQIGRLGVVGTHHDTVGAHEVFHGSAFLEEFGIRHHAEFELGAAFLQFFLHRRTHPVRRADRHRGFVHDDLVFVHVLADGACRGDHILQVSRAVFVRRRAHRDKLDHAVGGAFSHVGGEAQAAGGLVALYHVFQAGFVNGNLALLEHGDFALVQIQADHVIADFSQAGSGHQADIAGSDYADFQFDSPMDAISCRIACSACRGSGAWVMGRPITR